MEWISGACYWGPAYYLPIMLCCSAHKMLIRITYYAKNYAQE